MYFHMSELSDLPPNLGERERDLLRRAGVPEACWPCWAIRYRLATLLDALANEADDGARAHSPTAYIEDSEEEKDLEPLPDSEQAIADLGSYAVGCPGAILVHDLEYPTTPQVLCGHHPRGAG